MEDKNEVMELDNEVEEVTTLDEYDVDEDESNLGSTLLKIGGLAAVAGISYGVGKWNQRRKTKKKAKELEDEIEGKEKVITIFGREIHITKVKDVETEQEDLLDEDFIDEE